MSHEVLAFGPVVVDWSDKGLWISTREAVVMRRHGDLCRPGCWRVADAWSTEVWEFFGRPRPRVAVVDDYGNLVAVGVHR